MTTHDGYFRQHSMVVDSAGYVHIFWYVYIDHNSEIYYTKLNGSDGSTLIEDTRLTSNKDTYWPSPGVDSEGNVHIAWFEDMG